MAKTWDYHVTVALETTLEDNLAAIRDSVALAKKRRREVPARLRALLRRLQGQLDYALACAKAAYEAGARWVVLCDTNGGTLPHQVEGIVGWKWRRMIPGDHIGIHTHDDAGCAVANTLAAVRAGARHIQGTLNGLGERCGNANLVTLIPTLKLKSEYADRFEVGVSDEALGTLDADIACLRRDLEPRRLGPRALCRSECLHDQAGIHASAVMKDPRTYEHVEPQSVGDTRRLLVSDQGGRSNVLAEAGSRRHQARSQRSAHRPSAGGGEGQGGAGLRLRGRRRLFLPARQAHPRRGAGILHRRTLQRQCRAALERSRLAGHRRRGHRQGTGRLG